MTQWLFLVRSPEAGCTLSRIKPLSDSAFGFPASEFADPDPKFASILHPDDQPRVLEALRLASVNGHASCSYRVRHADGRYHRWHEEVRMQSVDSALGKELLSCMACFTGTRPGARLMELTRARLEGFLQASRVKPLNGPVDSRDGLQEHAIRREQLLDLALHRASDGLWDWDLRSDDLYCSPRWKELVGYQDHELPNHLSTWLKLVHPEDRDRAFRASANYVAGLAPRMEVEFRLRHKDGHWVSILARGFLVRDERNLPSRLVGSNLDVTPLREAEAYLRQANIELEHRSNRTLEGYRSAVAALAESEARLRLVLRASRAGVWRWDAITNTSFWDDTFFEQYGFDAEGGCSFGRWISSIHPDDRGGIEERIKVLREPSSDTVWDQEFRVIHPVKGIRWMHGLGNVVRDGDGRALSFQGINLDTTERKNVETALFENEERLRLAIKSANQGFYDLNLQTGETTVSPEYATMLGYDPAGFIATQAAMLERLHPEDRELVVQHFRECISGQRAECDIEFRQRTCDGGWKWIRSVGKVVARSVDGQPLRMLGTHTDISRRKAVQEELRKLNETLEERVRQRTEALRASEQRFRSLAEASFEGVMLSQDGRIVDCNDQLSGILACPREKLIGRAMMEFVPPEWHERILKRIRAGQDSLWEHEIIRGDGQVRIVETQGRSPDGPGGLRMTAVRDVTERRLMEREMALQQEELNRFRRMAELSEIGAGIIHQIGQPLTAIINNVAAAKSLAFQCSNPQCSARGAILDSDSVLKQVRLTMNRLHALIHPEQAHRELTDVHVLLRSVLEQFQNEASSTGIALSADLAPELPNVGLDAIQFQQALINLLRNACESVASCEPARRAIRVCTRKDEAGAVVIEVIDLGTGIEQGSFDQLFEPFYTTKPRGMGVGLSLCQTIVKAHGGSLTASNNPDGPGATFRITLRPEEQ